MKPSYLLQYLSLPPLLLQFHSLLGFIMHNVSQGSSAMVIN